MIRWLIQSKEAYQGLGSGKYPGTLLTPREARRLPKFKTDKRRQEWLLGRWTAKRLLLAASGLAGDELHLLQSLAIENDRQGAPYAAWEPPYDSNEVPYDLSVSHSHEHAFCALMNRAEGRIGADIEWIEPRHAGFCDEYFSSRENSLVRRVPGHEKDAYITAVWSAKESILKALHLGLTIDTRSLTCKIDPGSTSIGHWNQFDIVLNPSLSRYSPGATWIGWWQRRENFILTIAVYKVDAR